MRSRPLVLLTLCAACAHPAANSAAPPAPIHLSGPMERLDFYVGTWACEGTEYGEDGAPKSTTQLEVRVRPELGGTWLNVSVYEKGVQSSAELKGYEPASGHYRHYWVGPDGSSGSLTSGPWSGESLVFDEDHPAAAARYRMRFTRIDDQHFDHQAEVDQGKGYQLEYLKRCHKAR